MRLTIAIATATALLAAGVGAVALLVLRDDGEPAPVHVDERLGVLHDVRLGDSQANVRARLGDETDDDDGFFPKGADYTGPVGIRAPLSDRGSRTPPEELHYRDVAFLVSPTAGVFSMATLEEGARTRAGVGVGDRLETVRQRYESPKCGEAPAGEPLFGGEVPTYPWCRAVVGSIKVFFGGDPIESITMTGFANA